jgi:hypothetical protein
MRPTRTYVRSEAEPLGDIEEQLEGRVFHVCRLAYLPDIVAAGEIRPNRNGTLPTTFGYPKNGFFRSRDCVSLFDYRAPVTEEIRDFRCRCYPFAPARPPNGPISILFISPEAYEVLVPWTKWKEDSALSEMVVPYVEAGYPGPLPLRLIDELISVELTEDPNSLAARLRNARETAS